MNEILILIISNILSPLIVGYATYFQTKKRYETEVDSNLIANMKESLNFYQDIVEDTQHKLQKLLMQNKELEEKIETLKKEVEMLYQFSCIKEDCDKRIPSTCLLKSKLNDMYKNGEANE